MQEDFVRRVSRPATISRPAPVQAPQSPQNHRTAPSPKRKQKRLKLAVFSSVAIILLAVGIITGWFMFFRETSPIPKDVLSKVSFPVYYPDKQGQDFKLDTNSISATKNTLLYSFSYRGEKSVSVSIQPMTDNIDPEQYIGDHEFTSNIGKAKIIELPTRSTAAVYGGESWILINIPDGIPTDVLTQFINSLRAVER